MATDGDFREHTPPLKAAPAQAGRVRAEQRRLMLLDAADTVIRRVGPRVSATLIAKEAGVTKPIIYRHFADIQDLYRQIAARHNERLAGWLRARRERDSDLSRRERFRGIVEAFFTAIDRDSNLYRFLVHTGSDVPGEDAALSWFTRRVGSRHRASSGSHHRTAQGIPPTARDGVCHGRHAQHHR